MKNHKTFRLNYLSSSLLKKLGNTKPTSKQINLLASVLTKIFVSQEIQFSQALTEREISCLFWAAMGKTSKETACVLGIHHYTVQTHRREAKKKLGCKSTAEAIFKGMQFGYVRFPADGSP